MEQFVIKWIAAGGMPRVMAEGDSAAKPAGTSLGQYGGPPLQAPIAHLVALGLITLEKRFSEPYSRVFLTADGRDTAASLTEPLAS